MICIYRELGTEMPINTRHVVIQADSTPAEFPLTGENVKMLNGEMLGATIKFAPGSLLHCVDTGKNYYMNEDGTAWNEDGGNA